MQILRFLLAGEAAQRSRRFGLACFQLQFSQTINLAAAWHGGCAAHPKLLVKNKTELDHSFPIETTTITKQYDESSSLRRQNKLQATEITCSLRERSDTRRIVIVIQFVEVFRPGPEREKTLFHYHPPRCWRAPSVMRRGIENTSSSRPISISAVETTQK